MRSWLIAAMAAAFASTASAAQTPSAAGSRLLWFENGRPTPQALSLILELRAAASRGLRPDDYQGNRIAGRLARLTAKSAESEVATLDASISAAAARLLQDLHGGRVDPRKAGHDLDVAHARLDMATAIAALAASTDAAAVLDDYEPPFRQNDLLKAALARYRELAAEPGLSDALPALPAVSVKPGEAYAGAPRLRTLLRALGDLASESAPPPLERAHVLDTELSRALAGFQSRHGLAADGVLGRGTFRALTVPLDRRVRQIELSLERLRWLPPRIGSPPIVVNIPQFELFAFRTTEDREDSLLAMDVIVGKSFPRNNTPVFAADMRYIVLRPYWDVPSSILHGELLPKIHANPAWIERNGFEIVSGPGDDSPVVPATSENLDLLAAGRLRLRQKPGPGNALGLVKFMFPNRYNVYLHGTPAQSLFAQARRDFSHGCVRVADPVALASFVLRDDPRWTREALETTMLAARPTRINLGAPVRVFLIYATALATERGRVLFFEDIYGHDAKLVRLLASRRPSPRGEQAE
jgi:murein L,D-transpeptidase YcbB/YkuD